MQQCKMIYKYTIRKTPSSLQLRYLILLVASRICWEFTSSPQFSLASLCLEYYTPCLTKLQKWWRLLKLQLLNAIITKGKKRQERACWPGLRMVYGSTHQHLSLIWSEKTQIILNWYLEMWLVWLRAYLYIRALSRAY